MTKKFWKFAAASVGTFGVFFEANLVRATMENIFGTDLSGPFMWVNCLFSFAILVFCWRCYTGFFTRRDFLYDEHPPQSVALKKLANWP